MRSRTGVSMARVSLVMPVFNAHSFLEESIGSVVGQKWSDLELICVDDGSTDGSVPVIEDWMERDPRIRLVRRSGGGPGAARNAGVPLASGEFLGFVDADDIVPATALTTMITDLEQTDSDLVCGRVMRISTSDTWPSFNHFRAIPEQRIGTHISRSHSLLYDTTSWNKLLRRSFWDLHDLRFPEGLLYEDVCLMAKIHWEARAVDLLPDVVYHWRRRDDGVLSITQGFMEPQNFRERIAAIRRVQSELAEAPKSLREAAYSKALRHDLAVYLCELPRADQEFIDVFVELVGGLVHEVPRDVLRRLPPLLAMEYRLTEERGTDQLLEVIDETSRSQHLIPELQGRLRRHLVVPKGPVRLSSSDTGVGRRLPVVCGVEEITWVGEHLLIRGYAAIEGVPFDSPVAGVRRLRFTDAHSGRAFSAWVAPRMSAEADLRRGRADCSYRWSGFQVRIPAARFEPGKGRSEASWEVTVQLASLGAAKGNSLGPPTSGAARYCPPHLTARSVQLTVGWKSDQRLHVRARAVSLAVTSAGFGRDSESGATVHLVLSADEGRVRPGSIGVRLSQHGVLCRAVVHWYRAGSGWRGEVDLPLGPLTGLLGDRPYLTLVVEAYGRGTSGRLAAVIDRELPVPCGGDVLLVRPNRLGDLEAVLVRPRLVAYRSTLREGRLYFRGRALPTTPDNLRLVLRTSTGREVPAEVTSSGEDFEAAFPLLASAGLGSRCIPAGWWELAHEVDDVLERVQAVRGDVGAVERSIDAGPVSAAVRVDHGGNVNLQVFAVPAASRGPYRQALWRERHYEPARRGPVADLVLFETWAGKSSSDNPGALLDAALRSSESSELVVSVQDESVDVPAGARRVVRWTSEYYRALGSSRLIVANDPLPKVYAKRSGQRYLQTWHGTPLKRIGFDVRASDVRQRAYQESLAADVASWDWLLSPNPYSTEVLRRAFRYEGPIWETGYPRNDALVGPSAQAVRESARRRLGADPDATVILWAPTWRDDLYGRPGDYALPRLLDLDELAATLPPKTHFLIRAHHLVTQGLSRFANHGGRVINVSHHPDVNELYLASDALVTDYSSTMFDYALTGKPIVLLVPDLERYRDVLRGFYLDLEEIAPGPLCRNGREMLDLLSELPAAAASSGERYATFRRRFCSLEDGRSADRVWELLSATGPGGG